MNEIKMNQMFNERNVHFFNLNEITMNEIT